MIENGPWKFVMTLLVMTIEKTAHGHDVIAIAVVFP